MRHSLTGVTCIVAIGMVLCGCKKEPAHQASTSRPTFAPLISPPQTQSSTATTRPPLTPLTPTTTAPIPIKPSSVQSTAPATRAATVPPQPPPGLKPPANPKIAEFAGMTAPKPATWIWHPPANAMIMTEYVLPGQEGSDQAHLKIVKAGGTVEANVERWKTQFRAAGGGPVEAKIEKLDADGIPVTVVELAGEYKGMGAVSFAPDQIMISAIVEAPTGQFFLTLVGPAATIESNRQAYMEMIRGIRRTEPEK